MNTTQLRSFAQEARCQLIEQVTNKLTQALAADSSARRETPKAVAELEAAIQIQGKTAIIDKIAYIWFNRFCALRFMDIKGYNRIRLVSPAEGQTQPEILAEAKMGVINEDFPEALRVKIQSLLAGKETSNDPQAEAYRLLLVASCNAWHRAMPFLFQPIDDFTELLMPSDLLSQRSILHQTLEAIDETQHQDVEVIGWLYQFYISEQKDEVFAELKKNKKITPEKIPAATQLFTPNWIVRYLVQNSLGRLWLLNKPSSTLADQMEYYIPEQTPSTDFLKISRPEELKVCDPACGSGHMLTYAFDLLYSIYEEEGYSPSEIPELILTHNLYGIEIDERAGELAAFALIMKAREKHRRFFRKSIKPNICVLEKIEFSEQELAEYIEAVDKDFFSLELDATLKQFEEVDNFGSLIIPKVSNPIQVAERLKEQEIAQKIEQNLFLSETHKKVLHVLEMADYLSQKYQLVVANPPYMGSRGMNARLSAWAKQNYDKSKADLFAMFIERNLQLVVRQGAVGMITMQSWMFLSSYEKLREEILNKHTILSMAHLGARAFDSIGGEVVSTTAFVLESFYNPNYQGSYMRLVDGNNEDEKIKMLQIAIKQAAKTVGK